MEKGLIFDIKKYAIHDGPGIRTTVFLKGCPLHCRWCHNPEGQSTEPELAYRRNRCIGCGECVENCSRKAISLVDQHAVIDRAKCVVCRKCAEACPSEALSIVGRTMKVREVLQAIEKDRAFFDESEGGTTFSGGEPFQQPDFLNALLAECKDRDIRTVVDTCGHVQYKIIDRMRDKIDLFLYDIKTMSARKHVQYTGASNNRILENLKKLAQDGGKIMISLPIIPSINDDEMNVRKTAEFISSLRGIQQVNLLPYHRGGVEKYTSLGRAYSLKRVQPPSDHMIEAMKETIEAFGIKVGIGGG